MDDEKMTEIMLRLKTTVILHVIDLALPVNIQYFSHNSNDAFYLYFFEGKKKSIRRETSLTLSLPPSYLPPDLAPYRPAKEVQVMTDRSGGVLLGKKFFFPPVIFKRVHNTTYF